MMRNGSLDQVAGARARLVWEAINNKVSLTAFSFVAELGGLKLNIWRQRDLFGGAIIFFGWTIKNLISNSWPNARKPDYLCITRLGIRLGQFLSQPGLTLLLKFIDKGFGHTPRLASKRML